MNYRIIERSNKVGHTTYWLQKKEIRLSHLVKGRKYEEWKNVKRPTGVLWFKESVNFDSIEKMSDWIDKNIVVEPKPDKVIKEF